GTTPDRERERWRRVQAWKRVIGCEPDTGEVQAFAAANVDRFLGQDIWSLSHIFVLTVDPTTGLELSAQEQSSAKERITRIWDLIREGSDFGWMAARYSDDVLTA